MGRPCAVGLFGTDRVHSLCSIWPEMWQRTGEEDDEETLQGLEAAIDGRMGQAVQAISPSARSDELGFRLAKPA